MNLESEEHRYDAMRTFFPVRSNGITFIVVADDEFDSRSFMRVTELREDRRAVVARRVSLKADLIVFSGITPCKTPSFLLCLRAHQSPVISVIDE